MSKQFSISHCLYFVTGYFLMARSWNTEPKSVHGQVLFVVVCFAGFIVYAHWEATLISFLSVKKLILPFSSLNDLHMNTNFKLVVFPKTNHEELFKMSKDPLLSEVYQTRILPYIDGYPQVGLL